MFLPAWMILLVAPIIGSWLGVLVWRWRGRAVTNVGTSSARSTLSLWLSDWSKQTSVPLGSYLMFTLCSDGAMLPLMTRKLKRKAPAGIRQVGLATSNFRPPLCQGAGSLLPGSHGGILNVAAPVLATVA